jgi:hypothetical protein
MKEKEKEKTCDFSAVNADGKNHLLQNHLP